jgi:hypothetical protein
MQFLRPLTATIGLLSCILVTTVLAKAVTVTISGTPSAPTSIALNTEYQVKVKGIAASGNWAIWYVELYGAYGTTSEPTTDFILKGFKECPSGPCGSYEYAFNVVNQENGHFWWRGLAREINTISYSYRSADSSEYGAYSTP